MDSEDDAINAAIAAVCEYRHIDEMIEGENRNYMDKFLKNEVDRNVFITYMVGLLDDHNSHRSDATALLAVSSKKKVAHAFEHHTAQAMLAMKRCAEACRMCQDP